MDRFTRAQTLHMHYSIVLVIPGIFEQYPSTCQRLQRVPQVHFWKEPEAYQGRCHVAHQHGARAEEGDGTDREREDEEADGT